MASYPDYLYHLIFRIYPYQEEIIFDVTLHAILIIPYERVRFVFFGKRDTVC